MSDRPESGNRWEPQPDDTAPVTPQHDEPRETPTDALVVPPTAAHEQPSAASPMRRGWRYRLRLRATPARTGLAAASVVVLLAFGIGGFAVGRSVGQHGYVRSTRFSGPEDQSGQGGAPSGRDDGDGFRHGHGGPGFGGPGQQPGTTQAGP